MVSLRQNLIYKIKNFELGKGQFIRFTAWTGTVMLFDVFAANRGFIMPLWAYIPIGIILIIVMHKIGILYWKHLKKIEGEYENEQNVFAIEVRTFINEFKDFKEKVERSHQNTEFLLNKKTGGKM